MINTDDLTAQKQVYTYGGQGRWAVLGYFGCPTVTMVNLGSGERLTFGLAGHLNTEFEPIPGETCDLADRAIQPHAHPADVVRLVNTLRSLVGEPQPRGIDRPVYQHALRELAKWEHIAEQDRI